MEVKQTHGPRRLMSAEGGPGGTLGAESEGGSSTKPPGGSDYISEARQTITVRDLLNRTFEIIRLQWPVFLTLAVIVLSPSLLLELFLDIWRIFEIGEGPTDFWVAGRMVNIPLRLALSYVAEAVVIVAAVQQMRGYPMRIGEVIATGLRRFGSVVIGALLVALVTGLGYLLLIIPGIILQCMLLVTLPAIVMEQKGPVAGMRRSYELTMGYKGTIFLAGILIYAVPTALQEVVKQAGPDIVALGTGGGGDLGTNLFWLGLQWVMTIFIFVVSAVLSAVFYVQVRDLREGVRIDELASVFR